MPPGRASRSSRGTLHTRCDAERLNPSLLPLTLLLSLSPGMNYCVKTFSGKSDVKSKWEGRRLSCESPTFSGICWGEKKTGVRGWREGAGAGATAPDGERAQPSCDSLSCTAGDRIRTHRPRTTPGKGCPQEELGSQEALREESANCVAKLCTTKSLGCVRKASGPEGRA